MPELTIKLNPFFRQALREIIEPIEKRFQLSLAVSLEGAPTDDDELLTTWRDDLIEQLRADVNRLQEILARSTPEGDTITLSEGEADAALRAASAVRLKIHEVFLDDISDQALESGEVDIAGLSPEQHKPFACYSFLAGFQEWLCTQMMPGFPESWDPDE